MSDRTHLIHPMYEKLDTPTLAVIAGDDPEPRHLVVDDGFCPACARDVIELRAAGSSR